MRVINFIYLIALLILLVSCVPAEKQETVVVETKGIEELPEVEVLNGGFLGEFVVDSQVVSSYVKFQNKSAYEITDINVRFIDSFESNAKMTYEKNELAEDLYPGESGDCSRALSPGKECYIYFEFNPNRRGTFKQQLILSYKNLIDEIKLNIFFSAQVGEFASLGFSDDLSIHGFGIFDRSQILGKDLILGIENNGGLSARNISIEVENTARSIESDGSETSDNIKTGFFVREHSCPTSLAPRDDCQIVVSYSNSNKLVDDPNLLYEGKLKISYEKDGLGTAGALSANLGATSSSLQARFVFTGDIDKNHTFADVITGTKSKPLSLKIQNDGFKKGKLNSFIFYDKNMRKIAVCDTVNDENQEVECKRLTDGKNIPLSELPFKIYERTTLPCIGGRSVEGKSEGVPGESCFFQIVYWPSTAYEELDSDFNNNIHLGVEYDDRLRDQENIITERVSSITYSFLKPAKLLIKKLKQDGEPLESVGSYQSSDNFIPFKFSKFTHETDKFFDLGDISMVRSEKLTTKYTLIVENIGDVPAVFKKVSDSQFFNGSQGVDIPLKSGNDISKVDFMSECDPGINTFFREVTTTCPAEGLAKNTTCQISFILNPFKIELSEFDASKSCAMDYRNKMLFFDHLGDTITNAEDVDFKQFNFFYANGSLLNDDGSPYPLQRSIARLSGNLINKAILEFSNRQNWSALRNTSSFIEDNPAIFGNEGHFYLYISNVGTNDVSFMHFEDSGNLNRNEDVTCSSFSLLDIEGSDFPELSSADYEGDFNLVPVSDCYDHIGSSESVKNTGEIDSISPLVNVGSIQKRISLREGETCVLKVQIKNNPLDPTCYSSALNYEDWYHKTISKDIYTFMNYEFVEDIQKLPFSPMEFDETNPYLHLPNFSFDKVKYQQTLKVRYYDGDQNIPRDQSIFGEKKLLMTEEGDDLPSALQIVWFERPVLFISNVKPFEKTLLMRNKFKYKVSENETEFVDTYFPPDSTVFPTSSPGGELFEFSGNKVELEKIFQENISAHRELFPDDESRGDWDWEVFLGTYHISQDPQIFDFSFGHSGFQAAGISGCEIEYTGSTFNPNETAGIVPSEGFYNRLNEFGCFISNSSVEKNFDDFAGLADRQYPEDSLLKYVPAGESVEHQLKITFTIDDHYNPEPAENAPTMKKVTFSFRGNTVEGDVPGVGFELLVLDENESEFWEDVEFNNSKAALNALEAPEESSSTLTYKITNLSQLNAIMPNILIESVDDPLASLFDLKYESELPDNVMIRLCENQNGLCESCDEIGPGGACYAFVNYTPTSTSRTELFNIKFGIDWPYGTEPDLQKQRKFLTIPIRTTKLEPGEIIMKAADLSGGGSLIQCSEEELNSEKQGISKRGSSYEAVAFNIDIGEVNYSDAKNGIHRYFCIKNPKTLPVKIWDDDEKWTTTTINNIPGMVEVTQSYDKSLTLYIHERCLHKLQNSSGQLRPLVDDDYGILDTEEPCGGIARYKPFPESINKSIQGSIAGINYFGYDADINTDTYPGTMIGLNIKGFVFAPESYASVSDRSVYSIETSDTQAEIRWSSFAIETRFAPIKNYYVLVETSKSLLTDNDKLSNVLTNSSMYDCKVPASSAQDGYLSCVIPNLSAKKRYYVRIIPSAVEGSVEYLSFNPLYKYIEAFYTTGYDDFFYDYKDNQYIDRSKISDDTFSRDQAFEKCLDDSSYEIFLGSKTENVSRELINLEQWEKIISQSSDTENLSEQIWLGDEIPKSLVGLGQYFGGDDFNDEDFPYEQRVDDYNTYYIWWTSEEKPEFFYVLTVPALIDDPSLLSPYGSIFIQDTYSSPAKSWCYGQLPY